jgi:hypothetical protein
MYGTRGQMSARAQAPAGEQSGGPRSPREPRTLEAEFQSDVGPTESNPGLLTPTGDSDVGIRIPRTGIRPGTPVSRTAGTGTASDPITFHPSESADITATQTASPETQVNETGPSRVIRDPVGEYSPPSAQSRERTYGELNTATAEDDFDFPPPGLVRADSTPEGEVSRNPRSVLGTLPNTGRVRIREVDDGEYVYYDRIGPNGDLLPPVVQRRSPLAMANNPPTVQATQGIDLTRLLPLSEEDMWMRGSIDGTRYIRYREPGFPQRAPQTGNSVPITAPTETRSTPLLPPGASGGGGPPPPHSTGGAGGTPSPEGAGGSNPGGGAGYAGSSAPPPPPPPESGGGDGVGGPPGEPPRGGGPAGPMVPAATPGRAQQIGAPSPYEGKVDGVPAEKVLSQSIHKLKMETNFEGRLSGSSWYDWSYQFQLKMTIVHLWPLYEGTIVTPVSGNIQHNCEFAQLSLMAFAVLNTSVSEHIQQAIRAFRSQPEPAKKAWDYMLTTFQTKDSTSRILLADQLTRFKQRPNEDLEVYINRL